LTTSSAERYYRGADTAEQSHQDRFTADGVRMVVTSAPDRPLSVAAVFGPVFRSLINGMAPAVRALADAGNSVIFDHVLHDLDMHNSAVSSFEGLDVFWVGVVCPVEILEEREASRGDRVLGRAGARRRRAPVLRLRRRRRHRQGRKSSRVDQVLAALASLTGPTVISGVAWAGNMPRRT
jgi:chloramphenicol 3-O-phosphotransferase